MVSESNTIRPGLPGNVARPGAAASNDAARAPTSPIDHSDAILILEAPSEMRRRDQQPGASTPPSATSLPPQGKGPVPLHGGARSFRQPAPALRVFLATAVPAGSARPQRVPRPLGLREGRIGAVSLTSLRAMDGMRLGGLPRVPPWADCNRRSSGRSMHPFVTVGETRRHAPRSRRGRHAELRHNPQESQGLPVAVLPRAQIGTRRMTWPPPLVRNLSPRPPRSEARQAAHSTAREDRLRLERLATRRREPSVKPPHASDRTQSVAAAAGCPFWRDRLLAGRGRDPHSGSSQPCPMRRRGTPLLDPG